MVITRWWAVLLLGVPVAFLCAFFVVPFGVVVLESLRSQDAGWTFAGYAKAIGEVFYWQTLLLTFQLSLWVTLVTFVVGYPVAYWLTYAVRNRWLRRLCYIIVVTPLFTSNIVRA